jgi:hypothetical protein
MIQENFTKRTPAPRVIEPLSNPKIVFLKDKDRYYWSLRSGNGYLVAQCPPTGYASKGLMIQRCCETVGIEEFAAAPLRASGLVALRHEGQEAIDVEDRAR